MYVLLPATLSSELYKMIFNSFQNNTWLQNMPAYNAFNVYCRELAPGTVSLTGDRAQGDDSKYWA